MKNRAASATAVLLLLLSVVFFSTCHKEYSYEGGPKKNTAVYTLVASGATCTGSVVSGKYYVSKTLSTANSVQLQVNVTVVGYYTIATATADGFAFSASGSFANTGLQNVILYASGTPAASGNFSFVAGTGAGCSFSVAVIKEPVIMASFTTDCAKTQVSGNFTAGEKISSVQGIIITVNVTATGAYSIATDTLDGISFSAAGTFTGTGPATVILRGSGTPEFARNLIFTFNTGAGTCTFNLTITDPEPLAVYVLESGFGTPNPCTYLVSGNYILNTALNASNTVTISVYVTVTGHFTISTAVVGGMMFAYSGTFTAIGAQKVTLQGSGTPAAKGPLSFAPEIVGPHPLGGQTCGFIVQVP